MAAVYSMPSIDGALIILIELSGIGLPVTQTQTLICFSKDILINQEMKRNIRLGSSFQQFSNCSLIPLTKQHFTSNPFWAWAPGRESL